MTIISLFRRYQRWNPVHPTYGAFWGLGIGAGCGVGWGPGFGPEAVGFVGGGCGIGFSVGVTFIGFGIGLPASGLTCLPYNALSYATCEMFNFAKLASPVVVSASKQGLRSMCVRVAEMDMDLLKALTNIQCSNLTAVSTLVESNAHRSWKAVEKNILNGEQKLCQMRFQTVQSLKRVWCQGKTGSSK